MLVVESIRQTVSTGGGSNGPRLKTSAQVRPTCNGELLVRENPVNRPDKADIHRVSVSSSKLVPKFKPYPEVSGKSTYWFYPARSSSYVKKVISFLQDSIPDPDLTPRTDIRLKGIPEEKLNQATLAAKEVQKECGRLGLSGDHVSYKMFEEIAKRKIRVLESRDKIAKNLSSDQEFLALVAYHCVKNKMCNPDGYFNRFPTGFFDHNSRYFEKRVRTLGKHFYVDLMHLDTAAKIEEFDKYADNSRDAGLSYLLVTFSPTDLLRVTFPGYLEGENPPIRDWFIYENKKWVWKEGDTERAERIRAKATRACKGVLKYGEKVINPDRTYNFEEIRKRNWGLIFHNKKYGTRGMMDNCPYTTGALAALRLAAPELIGIEENQILPSEIRHNGMWEEHEVRDAIAEHLVEKKLKCTERGKPSAKKIKEVTDWAMQFREIASHSLSSTTAYDALMHRYPHLFGWGEDQIKPWEIRYGGMWDGETGLQKLKEQMAWELCDAGLGEFYFDEIPPRYTFTKGQLTWWMDSYFADRNHSWKGLFDNLQSGLRHSVCHDSLVKAFKVFLRENINAGPHQDYLSNKFVLKLMGGDTFNLNLSTVEQTQGKRKEELIAKSVQGELTTYYANPIEGATVCFTREANLTVSSSEVETARIKRYDLMDVNVSDLYFNPEIAPGFNKAADLFINPVAYTPKNEKYSYLERVLFSRVNKGSANYVLSESELRTFLDAIKIFACDLNISTRGKDKLSALINDLLKIPQDSRKILISAVNASKATNLSPSNGDMCNSLYVLDQLIRFLVGVVNYKIVIDGKRNTRIKDRNAFMEQDMNQVKAEEEKLRETELRASKPKVLSLVHSGKASEALLLEVENPFEDGMPGYCKLKAPLIGKLFDDKFFSNVVFKIAHVLIGANLNGDAQPGSSDLKKMLDSNLITDDDLRIYLGALAENPTIFYNISLNPESDNADCMKAALRGILESSESPRKILLKIITNSGETNFPKKASFLDILDYMTIYFAGMTSVRLAVDKANGRNVLSNGLKLKLPEINGRTVTIAESIGRSIKKEWEVCTELLNRYANKKPKEILERAEKVKADTEKLIERGVISENKADEARKMAMVLEYALPRVAQARTGKDLLIELGSTQTTYERFSATVRHTVEKLNISQLMTDELPPEIETLIALECLEPKGFLTELPDEMFHPHLDDFMPRISAMWRYVLAS